MSSPPGTPKRKGLRSLLPGPFSRSRSRSPSQSAQIPDPNTLSSTPRQSGDVESTSRITPATSPTDGSATGPHAANPSTIPRIIEPSDSKASQTRRRAAWNRLRASLQVLNEGTGIFPTISSAAGILISCLDGLETAASDQQEYEDLSSELTRLGEFLSQRIQGPGFYPISKSFINISKSIEQQAQEVNAKLMKKGGGGIRQATVDEEDILRHYRRIESLFRQLQADVTMSTWSIANEHLANTRLEGLNPVKQATYDSSLSTEIDPHTCTEGTRVGVLAGLSEWHHDPSAASVYWMNGMAGTGKTTIASYQLARYSTPFKSVLCEVLDQDPDIGTKTLAKQFEKLLKEPLARVKDALSGDLTVVIDALDECPTEIPGDESTGARNLPANDAACPVSGRHPSARHRKVAGASGYQAVPGGRTILHVALAASNRRACEQIGALFIYAATLVRYIRSGERSVNPQKRLRSVLGMTAESTKRHAQIDALYTAVLKSALSEGELEVDEAEDVRVVLRTVLFAQEPISIDTIATLAEIDDPQRVKYALQPLRSVLHQSEQTGLVSTLHASFPDFMFNNERSGSYFYDVVEHSQLLARRCFSVMKAQLQFNICHLSSSLVPDKDVTDLEDRIRTHIPPTLAYTCRHWANHLELAHSTECLLKILTEFLSDQFLFWMEVLNLRQEMRMGVEVLVKAKHWLIRVESTSEILSQIEDCRNFFTSFAANPISRSTPHIYISSLPLCPRSNLVYQHYWKHTRGLLELKGNLMESREGAALATWKMESSVNSVTYSPDGTQVAVGCSNGSFSIHDAHDGSLLLGPFEVVGIQGGADESLFIVPRHNPGSITSVSYSRDGTRVVSASKDGTIRVWSTHNGQILAGPFHGDETDLRSVVFSPDGALIVSGSWDNQCAVRFWDPNTGIPVVNPPAQVSAHVTCVAFSPDGRYVAFGQIDGTIKFANASDNAPPLAPIEDHTEEVTSLAFSPDGIQLIFGSRDHTVRVWNISEGALATKPLEGHTDGITSIAISPDGRYIASGSYDKTVRVWNIDGGTPFAGPFSGHSSAIYSVAYSSDGTRLVSGSEDETIRVWNVSNGLLLPPRFEDHMIDIQTAIFSPDDQSIFSSSPCGIWAWDVHDGSLVANITEGRPHSAYSSTMSHDYTHDAVFCDDHSVQILSIEDGDIVTGPLRGHTDMVTCASFSRDDNLLVTGSKDRTVRVWDLNSGELLVKPFPCHTSTIVCVAFSFDNSKVLSYAEDKSIQVWNLGHSILDIETSVFGAPSCSSTPTIFEGWTIQDDGWVTNGNSSLMFWFPADLASTPSPHTELIITGTGSLVIPKQKILLENEWTKCYTSW